MPLTILSVAYPLTPVGPDAVGGAEQVLSMLDAGIVAAGHHSLVIAQKGSVVAGRLLAVPAPEGRLDEAAIAAARARHAAVIRAALVAETVDVVHLHGIDFDAYLPPPGPSVLATLHLPPAWYGDAALAPSRPDTWLVGVSRTQHAACRASPRLLPPIPNGIALDRCGGPHAPRAFALCLGRICPEKGQHLALDAARRAGMPLLLAGEVFPYPAHRAYFDREVEPRMGAGRRFVGPVAGARKRRLLAGARCVVLPSLAPETSSLVAREALASGTPVVGFRVGALAEAVEEGVTGFLVESGDVAALAGAMARAGTLDRAACRRIARARFGQGPMVAAYLDLYGRLARRRAA